VTSIDQESLFQNSNDLERTGWGGRLELPRPHAVAPHRRNRQLADGFSESPCWAACVDVAPVRHALLSLPASALSGRLPSTSDDQRSIWDRLYPCPTTGFHPHLRQVSSALPTRSTSHPMSASAFKLRAAQRFGVQPPRARRTRPLSKYHRSRARRSDWNAVLGCLVVGTRPDRWLYNRA